MKGLLTFAAVCLATFFFTSQPASSSEAINNNSTTVRSDDITKIYLISSCHLDLGFADSLVNIVNRYFDQHFPEAIKVANDLKQNYTNERLVFTTHAYLIWLYLNCPVTSGLHCPNDSSITAFKKAVKAGDIVWHAYPFNAQPEVYDQLLAEFGIQLSFDISKQLDIDFKPNTMSQRDVPGLTRSMIPILTKNGVKAITVGVNGASMPPALPSAFKWTDKTSNTHILAMWHPKGYGGQNGVGTDSMVIVPGMSSALAFGIRVDNSGPPSATEVVTNFATLHELYPKAEIVASGYNEFVNELETNSHLLEEHTEEVGDTWIHGVSSDPWKTVQYREMLRLRTECLNINKCSLNDVRFYNFSVFLLKYGEHTWGKDVKSYLKDFTDWEDASFQPLMFELNNYNDIVSSWLEQRLWSVDYALEALGNHPLRDTIVENLGKLYYNGRFPTLNTNYQPVQCGKFTHGGISFEFSKAMMAIKSLNDSRGSSNVTFGGSAKDDHLLGQLVYNAYNHEDYLYFLNNYLVENTSFAPKDFGKPGLQSVKISNSTPKAYYCWEKEDKHNGAYSVLVQGLFSENIVKEYGGPQVVWLEVSLLKVTDPKKPVDINMTLYLVNKSPCRIPESLSFYFRPNGSVVDSSKMTVSKLGQYIDVLDVIKNGSKHVHSTDEGVRYNSAVPLKVKAWDTNVVSVGGTNVFPVPMETPDPDKGFAFNIFNNLWGTNYVMWYPYRPTDASSKYRFTMTLPPSK